MWATRTVTLELVSEALRHPLVGLNNEVEGPVFTTSRIQVNQQMLANKTLGLHSTTL